MNAVKLFLIAATASLFVQSAASESRAAATSLQPIGYEVQPLCYYKPGTGNPAGNFWMTVGTFRDLDDAEDYQDFLLFLACKDFRKLLLELDLPGDIYVHGFDYRIRPIYGYQMFLLQ